MSTSGKVESIGIGRAWLWRRNSNYGVLSERYDDDLNEANGIIAESELRLPGQLGGGHESCGLWRSAGIGSPSQPSPSKRISLSYLMAKAHK
ncbi:hypothetical protein VNO80_03700 [Phaseolus coccineus]|uniref:Uncharacterized protein n=1 Tax=Phaseolus coccineus TaxID=3886 RepID=A0AAN9NWK4_PHACN